MSPPSTPRGQSTSRNNNIRKHDKNRKEKRKDEKKKNLETEDREKAKSNLYDKLSK